MARAKAKAKPPRKRGDRATYQWKAGTRFAVRAAAAGAAIEQIRRRNGGQVTPAAVVDAARDPAHPLHPAFVWDDTEAAERYRQHQARVLVNSIRVVVTGGGVERRTAYVSVQVREGGRAYLPTSVALSDEEYRAQALAEALASLRGWRERYRHLTELADVFAAIDRRTAA